ncbi:hypothetical protein OpiT1DRAFT_00347 [Opitutaceae bacterium TAV1]|nr:hypothetical protein OpiT1DRAFT_00347 [Opitutaceae bacterium TAV1]
MIPHVSHTLLRTLTPFIAALAAFTVQADPRTFTDTQGRSMEAELLDADDKEAKVRRTDGRTFTLPLNTLSKTDRDYIADWLDAQIMAAAGRLRINVSKFKDTTEKTKGTAINYKEEEAGYVISLFNESMVNLTGLEIEYRIYKEDNYRYAVGSKVTGNRRKKERSGNLTADYIQRKSKIDLKTETITLLSRKLRADWYYADTSKRGTADELDGIWLRIYRGKIMVAEYATSEELKKDGW